MKPFISAAVALSFAGLASAVPNNPYSVAVQNTYVESLTVSIAESGTATDVAKAYIHVGLKSDSAAIVSSWQTRPPNDSMTPSQIQLGGMRTFRGLSGGVQYYFFVVTANASGVKCAQNLVVASLRRLTTTAYPANVLSLSAAAGYNTVPLTIKNISQINASSVDKSKIFVFVNAGSLITDPKCTGCRRDTVNLSGAGDTAVYTVKNVQPATTYYLSISFRRNDGYYASIDTNGANKNGLAAATLSAIPLPAPPKDSISISLIDPSTLRVDWTKIMTLAGIQGNRFLTDAVILVTDNNYFTGTVTQTEETSAVTIPGSTFVGKAAQLSGNQTVVANGISFATTKYVTFALKARDDPAGPVFYSAPVTLGTVLQAAGGDPYIEGLEVNQVNDQYVRIKFTPRDPDQAQIAVKAVYRVDGIEGDYVKQSAIGNVDLGSISGTLVQSGQACSAYVDLTQNFIKTINLAKLPGLYFKNSDTTLLTLVIYADDGVAASGSDSETVDLHIDLRPPSPPRLNYTVSYNAGQITVNITDSHPGDLQKIYYGPTAAGRFGASVDFVPSTASVNLASIAIYLAFADTFGNKSYADWSYFVNQTVTLTRSSAPTFQKLDQDNLKLTLLASAVPDTGRRLNLGRYTYSPAELSSVTGQGFDRVRQDGYVLLSQASFTGGGRFFDQGFDVGFRAESTDADLKIYRYIKETNQVEYLGGRYEYDATAATGYVVASGLGRDSASLYRYYNPPAAAATADSMFLFVGRDLQEPVIDPSATALSFDGTNMNLHVKASDNTVNLDARVSIFGFEGETSVKGWARATFFSRTLHDLDGPGSAAAAVDVDFAKSGLTDVAGQLKTAATLNRGLFAAVMVSDGGADRRKNFFLSLEQTLPLVSGVYGKMKDNWRLVSFPGATADAGRPLHVMEVLKPDFAGKYDPDRLRLARLKNQFGPGESPFEVFSKAYESNGTDRNDAFVFSPNASYLMITHSAADNDVSFSRDNVKTPGLKSDRGFLLYAATAGDFGWRLLSLPFRGAVNVGAVNALSVTSNAVPFSSRIYKILGTGASPWQALNPAAAANELQKLGSANDNNDCFLAYLFPGDLLFAPLTDDTAYFKRPAARARNVTPQWTLDVSLKNHRGELLDHNNRLGIADVRQTLPDLPVLGPASVSILNNDGRPLSLNLTPAAGWRLSVNSLCDSAQSLLLDFSALPPSAGPLHLVDRAGRVYVDLADLQAGYPLRLDPRAKVDFEIVPAPAAGAGLRPLPSQFGLLRNTPNPFNPSTVVHYQIPLAGSGLRFSLDIFDISGKKVATLAQGSALPGFHSARFSGTGSGIYFCRLSAGNGRFSQLRRMVLVR